MIDPLDLLLNEAMKEQSRRKVTVKATPSKEKAERPKVDSAFSNPENWELKRTIALIHQPTNTLLGNFHEFQYKRISWPGGSMARKLVRVTEPCATDGMETVTGDWWLNAHAERAADPQRWIETRDAVVGVTLAECGLHCAACAVRVRLEFGGIARVELAEETRFICAARDTFLILAAGVDVLQGMSFDSKLALRAELNLGGDDADESS